LMNKHFHEKTFTNQGTSNDVAESSKELVESSGF
jgi:hypothetical protein